MTDARKSRNPDKRYSTSILTTHDQ